MLKQCMCCRLWTDPGVLDAYKHQYVCAYQLEINWIVFSISMENTSCYFFDKVDEVDYTS